MACEDIPSLLDLQNTKKHVDDFGRLMGTSEGDSTNEVTGQVRPTYNKVMKGLGYTRVGTFATGGTLTNGRQTLLWDIADGGDGQEYGWSGSFPPSGKVVPPGSTPLTTGGIAVGAWISRFDPELRGQVREALRRSYAEAGYNLVPGSFEVGGALVNANDVLIQERTGKAFSGPAGVVDAGTDPTLPSSGYVPRTDAVLRGELAGDGGAGIVGGLAKPVTWVGFAGGADPTGVATSKAAFQAADASVYQNIYVPEGNYNIEDYVPAKRYYGPGKLIISAGGVRFVDSIPNVPNYNAPNTVAGGGASFLGQLNTLYGYNVGGNFAPSAKRNSLFGHNLGSGDTIYPDENQPFAGSDNNGFGYHALKKNQTGSSNNAFGGDALNENKTGSHNCAFGQAAGQQIAGLSDGCYFGSASGGRADSGNGRAAYFGRDSGRENRNTSNNASFGWGSGRGVTPLPTKYTGDGVTTAFDVPDYVFTGTKQVRVDIDGVNILPTNYSVTGTNGIVTLNFAPAVGSNIVLTATIGSASWSESSIYGARAAYKFTSGRRASIFGFGAAENATAINNSLVLGDEAAYSAGNISGSIIIGPRAYRAVTDIQNKFIVANQASTPYMDGTMIGPGDSGNYLRLDANFSPNTANTRLCGTSSRPWAGGATQTAFEITSDEDMKMDKASIPDAVLDAWSRVGYYQYRLIDSVEKKGSAARLHFGVLAQEIVRVFDEAGLNACDYGIVCLSEWDAEPTVYDDKGALLAHGIEEGSRWSVRYEECMVLEAALQRRNHERLLELVTAMEDQLG